MHGFERTHGSREVVRVDDVPIPDLATGEVLIRVLRAGLNHGDLHMREDAVQYSPEVKTVPDLPMIIGHDRLGEVVEVVFYPIFLRPTMSDCNRLCMRIFPTPRHSERPAAADSFCVKERG